MKTGKAAKLFGKDTNTINNWVDRYLEFFSKQGRGEGNSYRDFTPEDLIILNTIKHGRDYDNESWEEIRARLKARDFVTTLPPEATAIQGDDALTIYNEVKTLTARNEVLEVENEKLNTQVSDLTERNADLREEIGKWKALAELYERLWKEARDDKDGR